MIKEISLSLPPEIAYINENLQTHIAKHLHTSKRNISDIEIVKRSIDARKGKVVIQLMLKVYIDEKRAEIEKIEYKKVKSDKPVVIVGSGPAGLFAALELIENGIKPIIIERGKDVSKRKIDIAEISRNHIVNEDSNYCFGEGGAGTFSDGKLYTRSTKRGDKDKILRILHQFGAKEEILYDAHPHIGTDKLPTIIKNIRETIINAGGEIHFNTKLTDIIIENSAIKAIVVNNTDTIKAETLILASGHSARDIYELLHAKNILIEAKPFAMGVRVEHPQALIDNIQYHGKRGDLLPAATYSLITQADGRGVYSFCMCPGGFIVPSATATNECVVNGMSPAARNSDFANSGIAVEIRLEDIPEIDKYGALAGLQFQQQLEQMSYTNGGKGQTAPAQRVIDFTKNKISQSLPPVSYIPGVMSSPLHNWLPDFISKRLKKAFFDFDKKMRGFISSDAVILGVESRTSSPVRIPRDKETLQHVQISGLYPCGEGAGYAGGIVSSAIDGVNSACRIAENRM